jgi:hypothetical protein
MASKGLRAISYQGTRNVEAGYEPSQTSEILIGYTACYASFVSNYQHILHIMGQSFVLPEQFVYS